LRTKYAENGSRKRNSGGSGKRGSNRRHENGVRLVRWKRGLFKLQAGCEFPGF
jgi:hypothetical protein